MVFFFLSVKVISSWRSECQELFTSSIYMIHNCSQPQIKHHKKVKMKTQNILNFLFWNSLFPLYKNLCWNTFHKGSSEFSEHFTFFPLSKKINHSVNYVVLLSSLAGVRPRSCWLANHYNQMLLVLLRPLSYKLSKECLHLVSLRNHQGGMTALTSINFYRQMEKIYKIS